MENEKKEKKENKLKGILKGIEPKALFVVFGICGTVLLLLRIYQTLFLMDPETGFFLNNKNITILPFYVLSIGLVLSVFLFFYLGRQLPVSTIQVRRNIPHALACLLFGITLVFDAVKSISEYIALLQTYISTDKAAEKKVLFVYIIFAALGAIVLILDAVVFFSGAAFGNKIRILRLIPVFWAFFLTIRFFSITASYIHSTQLFLTIFSVAFLMLYLFEYARKIAGIVPEENTAVFCSTGVVSAVLLLTVGITDLILLLSGKGCMPHCDFTAYSLTGGIFCITSLFLLKNDTKQNLSTPVPTTPLSVNETESQTEGI